MDGTQAFTTIHFVVMGLLAVLVVVAIVAGARFKRGRVKAEREVEAHAEEAGVEVTPATETIAEAPPAPAPVAPSPPPLGDAPVVGTPPGSPNDPAPTEHALADLPVASVVAPDGTSGIIDADAPDAPQPGDQPVTQLKGLGPKVAARLAELGIARVGQIAALDEAQAAALDADLGPFAGRLRRDRWVEQARLLAAGDRDGFERVFGKL